MCYTVDIWEKRIYMKFKELKLIEPLQMAIEKLNYTEATPIQEQAIPL